MGAARRKWEDWEIDLLTKHDSETVAQMTRRSLSSVVNRIQLKNKRGYYTGARTVHIPVDDVQIPPYCLHERAVRWRIPPANLSAATFGDPKPGYTAHDNNCRRLSVHDAIEICALHNGKPGETIALAAMYRTSEGTIQDILNGSWFDRLLPPHMRDQA